jgi:general secretion pathway protein G
MKTKHGFTLVEILIVVVILGVLAAIVIPVFGDAGTEAKKSALASDLQKIRLQLELYKNYHNGNYPCVSGSTVSFSEALTAKTDLNGNLGGRYGGYLERIPPNPFNGKATVRVDGDAAGAGTDGWRFDTVSGKFQADDDPVHAQTL